MTRVRTLLSTSLGAAALALVAGCGDDETAQTPAPDPATTAQATTTPATTGDAETSDTAAAPKAGSVKVVASGLEVPWDIAFLPNGDALVTERDNADILRIPAGGGDPEKWMTVDGVVPGGEGGLLGIAVSPDYATDQHVFVYFTAAGDNRVARIDAGTKRVSPIVTGIQKGQIHNGGALSFGPDGDLYVGVGETGDTGLSQDTTKLNGKILRISADTGEPAGTPPFGNRVWSYGHRNVQGFDWDGNRMWASEFGQNTTDEVNIIKRGADYGWPDVEGKADTDGGRYTNPVVTWSPTSTSSPSGLAVAGDDLYVGALAGRKLWQIPIDGASAGQPKALFEGEYGRIRAVVRAPNGSIWFSTSNRDGRGDPADADDRIIQLGV